jgi:predicted ATPase
MLFELKNIGAIKQANIELGKLTVLCGKNNTGKTYINYSIYGFLARQYSLQNIPMIDAPLLKEKLAIFRERGMVSIDWQESVEVLNWFAIEVSQLYTKELPGLFSVNTDEFANAEFNIRPQIPTGHLNRVWYFGGDKIGVIREKNSSVVTIKTQESFNWERYLPTLEKWWSFSLINTILDLPTPFILTAERTAIQLFQKELDKHKSKLVKELMNTRDLTRLEEEVARFALPVEENINFTRDSDTVIKSNSFLKDEKPELTTYLEDMLGVQYAIINGRKVVIDKATNKVLPLYLASTSVRTLFDLHLWLKHRARKGDILFIDEPELHLHPENQMNMARLLVRLVNSGIDVFVTTHSTYLVKEFNNLLMLANGLPDKEAMMRELGYTQDDILHPEDLRAYITHLDGTVSQVDVDAYGMVQSGFDDAIVQINENSNRLISAVDDL